MIFGHGHLSELLTPQFEKFVSFNNNGKKLIYRSLGNERHARLVPIENGSVFIEWGHVILLMKYCK